MSTGTQKSREKAVRAKPLSKRALSRLIPLTKENGEWFVDMEVLITGRVVQDSFASENKKLARRVAQAAREWVLSHSIRKQHELFDRYAWLIETGIISDVKRSDLVSVREYP